MWYSDTNPSFPFVEECERVEKNFTVLLPTEAITANSLKHSKAMSLTESSSLMTEESSELQC